MNHNDQAALACDLGALPAGEREAHRALGRELMAVCAQATRELEDGYAFQFAAGDYAALAEFIGRERLCCPFFHFALDIAPGGGPIELRIMGGAGAKAILRGELSAATGEG